MCLNKFTILVTAILLSLFTLSCTDNELDAKDRDCSKENLIGKCDSGKICTDGECKDIADSLCSPENLEGICETDTDSCLDGVCIPKEELCSEDNLVGKCKSGMTCVAGECKDSSTQCSQENPTGNCQDSKTCIDGTCREATELCSADNPTGLCQSTQVCNAGICIDKACENNQRRNCYPGEQTELNKGICRSGVQLCKNSIWGECKGAITPQNEKCDEIDNDCDGEIDENVKNICGDCRAESSLPSEIPNNNIDDDCDGLTDEDDAGSETCDGRMNQACYSGPAGTNGKGICKGGLRDCQWDSELNQWGEWGACIGQKLPEVEICDNIDNNCNGVVDENCQTAECLDEEICGNNRDDDCNNLIDDTCSIDVVRTECTEEEVCHNGFDDNCDGVVDEGCSCDNLTELECFSSDPSMVNHGETTQCQTGIMYCIGGESWGSCDNQILPSVEICDGIDNDCDGIVDNNAIDGNACGVCNAQPAIEICGNNIDDNCDGFVNENCPTDNCDNPSEEVCDGIDNDCDGLTDEGVLNSCGKCDDSCYEINIGGGDTECNEDSPDYPDCNNDLSDDFDDGQFDGVDIDEDGNITLNTERVENNFIWIANSGSDSVTKINTITGQSFGPFPVCDNPSRTAVTRDGGVWVACRDDHKITKLTPEGSLVSGFPITLISGCGPRGLAIDKDGNGWAGCYGASGRVYKISETGNILLQHVTNSSVYGLAIDSNGFLWNSGRAASKNFRLDTNKSPGDDGFISLHNKAGDLYGIVIDHDNNIWYGNYGGNSGTSIFKVTNNDGVYTSSTFSSGGARGGRGLAIDNNNHIWCAFSGSNQLAEYDIDGTHLRTYPSGGSNPVGVGIDSEGDVWVINYSGGAREYKYNPDAPNAVRTHVQHTLLGTNYTYSDMTGYNLRNITAPSGKFTLIQDTQYADSLYDSIRIVGQTPNNSKIKARIQVSNDQTNWSAWSNYAIHSDNNTDMPLVWAGAKPSGRYIKIEVVLELGTDSTKPVFSEIHVNWQRP